MGQNSKVYHKQGSNVLAIEAVDGGQIHGQASTGDTPSQAAAIAAIVASDSTAAPAGGTGAAQGAWETLENRDLAIITINANRTSIIELHSKMDLLLAACRNAGIISQP